MKKKYEDPVFEIDRFQFTNDLIMGSYGEGQIVDIETGDGDELLNGAGLDAG
ncbi:MAG: hypothetical protein PUB89_10720 [Oscillospiraceae bacterium]|nr:hypothetical protein [Oscillospiraceae bacterium]